MKRPIPFLLLFLSLSLLCKAQMSDESIIQYVSDQRSHGVSQEEIVRNLERRGVTSFQLERLRDRMSKQRSTGVVGDVLPTEQSRSRLPGQSSDELESYGGGSSSEGTSLSEASSFLFTEPAGTSRPSVSSGTEIYGHSLFSSRDLTFAPSTNLATPRNYHLGPGDEVIIDIWGASQSTVREVISPDGNIMVQGLGPVYLNGRTVSEADSYIKKVFSQIYSGLSDSDSNSSIRLSLGQNRSIQVNVMGEVMTPGTYQVSSFSTVFNAIYLAGGLNGTGSLRSIKLYRGNRKIAEIDLYDYILNGRLPEDIRLEDNDVVMVSPHSILVGISGRVRRPMLYEMKTGETLSTLIDYAGGLRSDAYRKDLRVMRMGDYEREIYTVSSESSASFEMKDGDRVYVDSILQTVDMMAEVRGSVYRAGKFRIGAEIRTVRDLVNTAGGLKEDAFASRALLSRTNPDKTRTNLALDIKGIMDGSVADEPLRSDDILYIPSHFDMGDVKSVSIYGEVLFPGRYRYADNTSIEDLIFQAGGLRDNASLSRVDVVRRSRDKDAVSKTDQLSETFTFSISEDLKLQSEGFRLMPYDEVYIRRSPGYAANRHIIIDGEVTFPGYYSMTTNTERLSNIISRAGGFSSEAYLEGARLERRMTDDERARQRGLAENLASSDSLLFAEVMSELASSVTFDVGINLREAIDKPGSSSDIILRDGDRIIIPSFTNTVRINGEVMYSNTTPYVKGKNLSYYIDKAGGYSQKAKKNKAYVVYMNGSVSKARRHSSKLLQPGCEIIVPSKVKREGLSTAEILSLGSTSASLATVVLALLNLLK